MGKVSQFFKNRYVISPQDHMADDYQHSDFGRTYGWWVLLNGTRVASLEYRSFLEEPVHLYQVHVLDPAFSNIDQDPEKWVSHDVVIESRYAEDYLKKGLEMAPVGKGMIVVQNLFVPEPYFKRQHDKIELFHDELLGNAEQSRTDTDKESTSSDDVEDNTTDEKPVVAAVPIDPVSNSRAEKKQQERELRRTERDRIKLEKEKAIQEKEAKREQERLEKEKAEAERLEAERIEQEKQAQLEAERLEQKRLAQVKLEQEKAEALRLEQEKLAAEHQQRLLMEQEKLAQEAEARRIAEEQAAASSILQSPAPKKSTPLPPLSPSTNSNGGEPWQSKLGGIPRQTHTPQNPSQQANDDSITEL